MTPPLLSSRALRGASVGLSLVAVALPLAVIAARTALSPAIPPALAHPDGTLRPRMVAIPPGTYTVRRWDSSPEKEFASTVTFKHRYALSETEITQGQFKAIAGKTPSDNSECGDSCPVEQVSWVEAAEFCNALSAREGLKSCYQIVGEEVTWLEPETCDGYRLPTETEWDVAAFAGTAMKWAGTDDESKICEYGWIDAEPCNAKKTAPVRQRKPNPWFLYDMTGNVWEWTWDCHSSLAPARPTPDLNKCGDDRVIRGGSFGDSPRLARVADRSGGGPSLRGHNVGFRVARSLLSSVLPSHPLPAPNP